MLPHRDLTAPGPRLPATMGAAAGAANLEPVVQLLEPARPPRVLGAAARLEVAQVHADLEPRGARNLLYAVDQKRRPKHAAALRHQLRAASAAASPRLRHEVQPPPAGRARGPLSTWRPSHSQPNTGPCMSRGSLCAPRACCCPALTQTSRRPRSKSPCPRPSRCPSTP